MNKKEFLDFFSLEDRNSIAKLYEKYTLQSYGKTIFTDEFYPPTIWNTIKNLEKTLQVSIKTHGLSEDSEKRIIEFVGENDMALPITMYEIHNLSKFKELKHKDYLGALMGLGIKREKISDLIIQDDVCYFMTFNDIADIINSSLDKVGSNPIRLSVSSKDRLSITFEELVFPISSERLDAFVAAITKKSREESVKLIEHGHVFINYFEEKEKNYKLKVGDIITIKQIGKYKFNNILGNTKKDKIRVEVKKFV